MPPILKDMLFGKTYFRKYRLIDHVSRSSLITLMISLLIYILGFIENYIALIICYFLIQILFILYMTAEISVSFRIPLKKAFIITLILHYIGLAAYAIILVVWTLFLFHWFKNCFLEMYLIFFWVKFLYQFNLSHRYRDRTWGKSWRRSAGGMNSRLYLIPNSKYNP